MPSPQAEFVTGLVLGAGGSSRLGRPKQLLPFGDRTLLEHTLNTARDCGFDQVVVNPDYGEGCSSSIAAALGVVNERCDVLVLMLGDQPGVTPDTVRALLEARGDAPLAVCRYDDGRGHPIAFARSVFPQLADLHGDKGVWRLLDERAGDVVDVPIAGNVPLDVDTPEDYKAVLAAAGYTEVTA